MTAKEYLGQAYRLDQRINSKLEIVKTLNALATKATVTLTGMPKSPNKSTSTMADTVTKIVDLQSKINGEIDRLVELKSEIIAAIKTANNTEYQTLLEKRYLCFETWEQISFDMGYSIQHIHRLKKRALSMISVPKRKDESKC